MGKASALIKAIEEDFQERPAVSPGTARRVGERIRRRVYFCTQSAPESRPGQAFSAPDSLVFAVFFGSGAVLMGSYSSGGAQRKMRHPRFDRRGACCRSWRMRYRHRRLTV